MSLSQLPPVVVCVTVDVLVDISRTTKTIEIKPKTVLKLKTAVMNQRCFIDFRPTNAVGGLNGAQY